MSNVEGWKKVRICELGTIVTGSTPDTKNDSYWGGEVPFVSPADFKSSAFVEETARTLSNAGVEQARLIPQNSILVTCIGSIGGIAIASCSCVTNQQINSILCAERFDDRFVFYVIQHNISKLIELAGTTTLPIINKSTFGDIKIVLPTFKSEQHQIAAILSTIDTAIEQTEAIIAKQQRIKTGLMQDLLTRGIDEHGNIRSEETHEFKDSPLGRVPVEWDVMKLSEATSKLITYGIVQPGGHVPDGVPFVQTKDLTRGQLDSGLMDRTSQDIHSAYERSAIHTGDIVIGIRASVGFVAEVPKELNGTNISRGVARLSPSKRLLGRYLFWIVRATHIQNSIKMEIKGSTYPEITLPALRNILIQIPNPEEQNQIAKSLDLSANQIRQTEFRLTKLRSLKTALMQDLLTGEVRVTPLLSESQEASA